MKLDFRGLGLMGSALLALGPFLPFVSIPLVGSVNYFSGGSGDGALVAGLSVVALAGTLLSKPNWLLTSAIASAAILGTTLVTIFSGAGSFSSFVSIQIGPLVIAAGAVALFLAYRQAPEEMLSRAKPFKPYSKGNVLASTLAFLGLAATLAAPVVFSYLYASINGQSQIAWLTRWFAIGFTNAALFVIAALLATIFFFRGHMVLSVVSSLLAAVLYVQVEESFWSLRSRELAADLLPAFDFVFLLPVFGSVAVAIAAGLRALSQQRKSE